MIDRQHVRQALTGPIPTIRTPFLRGGEVDLVGLRQLIDVNLDAGAGAIVLTAGDSHYIALSDAEIAEELGLDLRDVTEMRVVAEHDEFPIEEYEASARFKDAAAASYRQGGVKNLYRGNPPPTRQ